ncbi:MAG: hypothetical protein ACTHJJ_18055 [Intrasporangium sp.]|uniref:hypothetical protein n=1 Tax=Intrasporangium sp. TaxID=1925024 RepID=UPI003F80E0C7
MSNFDETGEAQQVEQDQVGRPAERAEQLRRGRDADTEMLMTDGGAADENAGAVDAGRPGGSGNASITEESSGGRGSDWQVNAEGTVRHAAGNTGANSAAMDDKQAAEDFETRIGEETVAIESGQDNGLNE